MVEYSNDKATPSDIAGGYSDEGYVPAEFIDPASSYDDMTKAGITAEGTDKLKTGIIKQQAPNPKLLRVKRLKILFLQYISKYLSNPSKYIEHPKQIKRLPSWFDDAIVLFKENEISRYQKKMIREFFYGLVQYRDNKMMTDRYGAVNTDEVNRQLGERSPYAESGENLDEKSFPRERDLQQGIDVRELMRETRNIDVNKPSQEDPFEEYGGINPYTPPIRITTTNKNKATFGPLGLVRTNPSNSTVNDYVSFNKREQVMPGETQSNPVQRPVQTNLTPVANIVRKGGVKESSGKTVGNSAFGAGKGMLGGVFGNMTKGMMMQSLGLPQPKVIPTPTVINQAQQPVERKKRKKQKAKMIRQLKKRISPTPLAVQKKSSDTISEALSNIKRMNNRNKLATPIKRKPINMQKTSSGLQTIHNMDKLFGQIRDVSSQNFGRQNMKMKVVTDIKDQCTKAFAKNKFKQESMNMKKNYFNDVKDSYPQMKMEIEEMGDIKENRMMQRSMNDVPKIINTSRTIGAARVGRGDMRPKSFGIVEYDFSIEPLGRKKSKKLELFDEDDFIERSR
jgi:hypothetical protein